LHAYAKRNTARQERVAFVLHPNMSLTVITDKGQIEPLFRIAVDRAEISS
jgi:hypothetical protein